MRKREPFEILRGLGMFLLIAAGALMAVRLQLLFPRSVIVWLTWRSTLLDKVTVTIKMTVTL